MAAKWHVWFEGRFSVEELLLVDGPNLMKALYLINLKGADNLNTQLSAFNLL